MQSMRRWILVAAIIAMAISSLGLALTGVVSVSAGQASPAITPTPTTEPPVFSATLSVAAGRDQIDVGDILTVTVDLTVSEGCQYPLQELILKQTDGEAVIFDHVDPPGDVIHSLITMPSVWTFRATQPGTATFDARSFGERYCGDYWNWHYLVAKSENVTVNSAIVKIWLPIVAR